MSVSGADARRAPALGEVAFDRARIALRVRALAAAIAQEHGPAGLVLASAGGARSRFAADLARELGPGAAGLATLELTDWPQRRLALVRAPTLDLAGRHAIVVEDAVDTGLRLRFLVDQVLALGADEASACVLLDRPARRLVGGLPVRYRGFAVADELHVGYGLELDGRFAELPDIHRVG